MTTQFDPYSIIGVSRDASLDLIRKAFRAKAKEVHPDAGGKADDFAALSRAMGILGDPDRRLAYDRSGTIDDSQEGNLATAALATIRNVVDAAIIRISQQGLNPEHHDLVRIAKEAIREAIKESESLASELRKSAQNALSIGARFHRADGENFLRRMIEDKAREFNKKADAQEQEKKRLDLALEIVSQYRFDFDNPMAQFTGGIGSTFVVMRTA